jgi:hypothetical protein
MDVGEGLKTLGKLASHHSLSFAWTNILFQGYESGPALDLDKAPFFWPPRVLL